MDYKIISDGCCDLTQDIIERYHLHIVPFYISFDQEHYYKEIEEIGIREVYDRMVGHPEVFPKTSLPSMQDYIDTFTRYIKQGMAVICLCFTPSLSGSYNCACNARDITLEEYPDAKISVINTEAATVSQKLMAIEAGRMQQAGVSYEQSVEILERMKKTNHIFFTVGDLEYLKHGGRIGKLASLAAGALSLKPIIILENGEISAGGIGRNRRKLLVKNTACMKKYFKERGESYTDYRFCVGYGYDVEEGKQYFHDVEKELKSIDPEIEISDCQIGATIAVHTGPYALGVGCVKRYECYL